MMENGSKIFSSGKANSLQGHFIFFYLSYFLIRQNLLNSAAVTLIFLQLVEHFDRGFSAAVHGVEELLGFPLLECSCGGGFAFEISRLESGEGGEFFALDRKGAGKIDPCSQCRRIGCKSHVRQPRDTLFVPDGP